MLIVPSGRQGKALMLKIWTSTKSGHLDIWNEHSASGFLFYYYLSWFFLMPFRAMKKPMWTGQVIISLTHNKLNALALSVFLITTHRAVHCSGEEWKGICIGFWHHIQSFTSNQYKMFIDFFTSPSPPDTHIQNAWTLNASSKQAPQKIWNTLPSSPSNNLPLLLYVHIRYAYTYQLLCPISLMFHHHPRWQQWNRRTDNRTPLKYKIR